MNTPKSKKCSKCLKTKRLTSFYDLKEGKYGKRAKCKLCMQAEAKAKGYYYKPRVRVISPTGARLTALFEQGLKECSVCKSVQELQHFSKRPTGKSYNAYDNYCITCRKQAKKDWHLQRNTEVRNFLYQHRVTNGCVDCGEKDPRILEFDHLRDKKFNLGKAHIMKGITLTEVKDEVRKCVVRCSNCHRRKTHKEQGTWLNVMYEDTQPASVKKVA